MRKGVALLLCCSAFCAFAETQVVDGVVWECKDGLCRIVEEHAPASGALAHGEAAELREALSRMSVNRIAQGCMPAEDFIRFLKGECVGMREGGVAQGDELRERGFLFLLFAILLGGLAMNLTPCVLPMIPINLMIIGKSPARGVWYGLGIALAYGALGVAAAIGGLAFGTIQANPWFNIAVAIVFVVLSLALLDVFFIDLSRFRRRFNLQPSAADRQSSTRSLRILNSACLFPFSMGALSAVLAGACVAPILISVLLLTGKLYGEGHVLALALPFVLGLGMALPWPFLGAGLRVLPKPGPWMKVVNRLFALFVLAFAFWYARLAWIGFCQRGGESVRYPSDADRSLRLQSSKPILVDCWATWCKNCAAMDRLMEEPAVRKELADFTVIRVQAESMRELNSIKGFESIRGLPAFVILSEKR